MTIPFIRLFLTLTIAAGATGAYARPTVLELFTSQGCSSCPPADALLLKLAADPQVLALSLHVDYWDSLGWKDPFASPDYTARQHDYAARIGDSVYTPQLVVDGAHSVVGSNAATVRAAIDASRQSPIDVPIALTATAGMLDIAVSTAAHATAGTVWALQFQADASNTSVQAGENGGRKLQSIHNVTRLTALGAWKNTAQHYQLPIHNLGKDRIAILLQADRLGPIEGAAVTAP